MTDESRICPKCKVSKPLTHFGYRAGPHKLTERCAKCRGVGPKPSSRCRRGHEDYVVYNGMKRCRTCESLRVKARRLGIRVDELAEVRREKNTRKGRGKGGARLVVGRRYQCSKCKKLRDVEEDYYVGADGKVPSNCIECESERRQGGTLAARKRAIKRGERPPVTPYIRKRYIALRENGSSLTAASSAVGISTKTGKRYWDEHLASGVGVLPAPDPIPYEKLTDRARELLDPDHFLEFCSEIIGIDLDPWAQDAAKTLLELIESPRDEYLIFNAPPGAGKSTVLTYCFAAWYGVRERAMGREPRVLLGHRVEPKARAYIRRLDKLFRLNKKLLDTYGRIKPEDRSATWSGTELTMEPLSWDLSREKEASFTAASQEGAVVSGRYRVNIWDDLVDKENSSTVEARETLEGFAEQEAESRIESPGLFVYAGARYRPEDLYWTRYQARFPDTNEQIFNRKRYQAHYPELCDGENHTGPWPEGCLLSPTRLPWYKIRKAMSKEFLYRLVWQQEDADPEGSLAEEVWFRGGKDSRGDMVPGCLDLERTMGELPDPARMGGGPHLSMVTVDPAGSAGYWSVTHYLRYPGGQEVVLRGSRRRMAAPDLLERDGKGRYFGVLEEWWEATRGTPAQIRYVVVETRSQQVWLRQYEFVQTWASRRGITIVPHDTNRSNKKDPAFGIPNRRGAYKEGRLRLPYFGHEDKLWTDQFIREACAWPHGTTDDMLMTDWFFGYHAERLQGVEEALEDALASADSYPLWATVEDEDPAWIKEVI